MVTNLPGNSSAVDSVVLDAVNRFRESKATVVGPLFKLNGNGKQAQRLGFVFPCRDAVTTPGRDLRRARAADRPTADVAMAYISRVGRCGGPDSTAGGV
jgi:hypothetical protein